MRLSCVLNTRHSPRQKLPTSEAFVPEPNLGWTNFSAVGEEFVGARRPSPTFFMVLSDDVYFVSLSLQNFRFHSRALTRVGA